MVARSTDVRLWISTSSSMTVTPDWTIFSCDPSAALRKSVAVAADDNAVLKDHAITDPAELAYRDVRVGTKIISDFRAFIDDYMGMQHGVAPDANIATHAGEWSDGRVLADDCRLVDECQRMNAGFGLWRLIEHRQRPREVQIWIGRKQHS